MKRWVIIATVLTLIVSAVVFLQALSNTPRIVLGIPGQWVWRYDHSPYFDRALFCFAAAALLGGLCYSIRDRVYELVGNRVPLFLAAAVALSFGLQASFASLGRSGFGQGVFWMGTPKLNNEFAEACGAGELKALLYQYQDPNRPFRIHLSTHPPGPVVFYLVQKRLWESSPGAAEHFVNAMDTLLPYAREARDELPRPLSKVEQATLYSSIVLLWLAAALAIVPLYFWAADLFGPATGIASVALYALTPSVLLFNPMTDLLYVPLAVGVLAMLHLGLARRDPAQLSFAGVLTWMALQCTLAFGVVLFVFGLYVALELYRERRFGEIVRLLAWPAGTFVALTILVWAVPLRYNSLLVWKLCLTNNASFNTGRTFLPWLIMNPLDFALFLGLPTSVLLLREVVQVVRRKTEEAPARFVIALVVTLILLNLSGVNRGEAARLWMPLMPMAAAIAACGLRPREEDEGRDWMFPTVMGALWVQGVLLRLSLDVLLPA